MLTNEQITSAISDGMVALDNVANATNLVFVQADVGSIFFELRCPNGLVYGRLYSKINRGTGDVVLKWRSSNAYANYARRVAPFKHNILEGTTEDFEAGLLAWITNIKTLLPLGDE